MSGYVQEAEILAKEALEICQNMSGWKSLKQQNGVQTFCKQSPHFKGNMYKFVAEIDEASGAIYNIMKPPARTEERLSWDKSIAHYERLLAVNDDIAIGLITTHTVFRGMIAPREFVDLYYFKTYDDESIVSEYGNKSWIFAKSVDFPNRPITKQYVRAFNYPAGYSVSQHKTDPNKCRLELFVNCDVGGMLPRYLVESALPTQQVAYIESVKSEARRRRTS